MNPVYGCQEPEHIDCEYRKSPPQITAGDFLNMRDVDAPITETRR